MNIRLVILSVCFTVYGGMIMAENAYANKSNEIIFNLQWAEASFNTIQSAINSENKFLIIHEDSPGDTKNGRGATGSPLRLGEKTYKHGIGTNSHSVFKVTLSKPAARFKADIGMDRNVDGSIASSAFHVNVAGKDIFVSKVFHSNGEVQSIDVPLNGAREFDLILDNGGDDRSFDQGIWADPRVVMQDGSTIWVDEIAGQAQVKTNLPFSFMYGGIPSAEFIRSWKSDVKQVKVGTDRLIRTLIFTDPDTGLEVKAVTNIYLDTPGVDWTVYFTNTGLKDTPIIEQVKAVDASVTTGAGASPILRRLNGTLVGEKDWMPIDEPILTGKPIKFESTEGRVSLPVSPFFNVDWGSGGVITAFGWSGQWHGSVERDQAGNLRVQAGMQYLHTTLHPGETIRSPRIMQLYWSGNDQFAAYNMFRRTMFSHIMPKIDGEVVTPPIVHLSTSFYELNDSTETNVLSHLDAIKGLGFEAFWLDAYWTCDGFPSGMGNYGFPIQRAEPKDRFSNGLRPIGDAAHKEKMKFVVWFEPERVAAGTFIAKENPEWVMSPGGDGSGLFNLGIPEAREFMTRYLNTVIKEYGMDCLRIDYNLNPLPHWQFMNAKSADRIGIAEVRYMEGIYRMWDDVLKANPHLFIDNCASGGCRIDLETCSRSIPLWRTDATIGPLFAHDFNQAAIQNQVMTAGLSRYVPFSTSGMMGSTPYGFRSGFNAGISFCEDVRTVGYPKAQLKQAITEGKRIRKYYFGDFYPVSKVNVNPDDWCITQYHRAGQEDGMVMAFRRHESPYASYACELREIDPNVRYEVTKSSSFKQGKAVEMRGSQLQRLVVSIKEMPGSILIEYRKVK
ncbi:MAG: NPCBM/NEW2 domain-containing protein [Armatimonadota bacterium]